MFNYSRDLFQNSNGSKIEFVILESSYDWDTVSRLIEWGGGSVSIKPKPMLNVINLSCKCLPWMVNYNIFSTSHVYACCRRNQKLSLSDFSIGKHLSEQEIKLLDRKYLALNSEQDLILPSNSAQIDVSVQVQDSDFQECHSKETSSVGVVDNSQSSTSQNLQSFQDPKKLFHRKMKTIGKTAKHSLTPEPKTNYEESLPSCSSIEGRMNTKLLLKVEENDQVLVRGGKTALSEIFPDDSASMQIRKVYSVYNTKTSCREPYKTITGYTVPWKDQIACWFEDASESD